MPSIQLRATAASTRADIMSQGTLDSVLARHELYLSRALGGQRAMIRYMQAPGLNFACRNLREADLTGANLAGARMAGADMDLASLYCADLTEADMRGASLRQADLRGVSLRKADLRRAILDGADLRQAVLARLDGPEHFRIAGAPSVDFTEAALNGARLNNVRLKGANFTDALLHGADLKGADLTDCTFTGAVLTGIDLTELDLDRQLLGGAILDPDAAALVRTAMLTARLEKADRWVATNGRKGEAPVLDGEDLRPLRNLFMGRGLTALSARNCLAIGVDFNGAQLQGARFDGADLRNANFTGADLRGASFRGARLLHARFDRADLRPLPLAAGQAQAVDLDEAVFAEDCFRHAVAA